MFLQGVHRGDHVRDLRRAGFVHRRAGRPGPRGFLECKVGECRRLRRFPAVLLYGVMAVCQRALLLFGRGLLLASYDTVSLLATLARIGVRFEGCVDTAGRNVTVVRRRVAHLSRVVFYLAVCFCCCVLALLGSVRQTLGVGMSARVKN